MEGRLLVEKIHQLGNDDTVDVLAEIPQSVTTKIM